jgi:putative copper export protein
MAEAIHDTGAARAAAIFYGTALLVISVLVRLLWASAVRDRRVLRPDLSKKDIAAIGVSTTPNIGFYVAVIVLAIFAPRVAVFGYLVIAIVALLRMRGDRASAAATTGD